MLRRFASFVVIAWALGFVWFAAVLPQPIGAGRSDAGIVLTGGEGRIPRALEVLDKGWVRRVLVAGVDSEVRPREFAAEYDASRRTMTCCVTLEQVSVDTRTNARGGQVDRRQQGPFGPPGDQRLAHAPRRL